MIIVLILKHTLHNILLIIHHELFFLDFSDDVLEVEVFVPQLVHLFL